MQRSADKPYIYVSFARGDEAVVRSTVDSLMKCGFRIKCSTGNTSVDAGVLGSAGCVISFISRRYVSSAECKAELLTAQRMRLDVLDVYIERVDLPPGTEMMLCLNQALHLEEKKRRDLSAELSGLELLAKYKSLDTVSKNARSQRNNKAEPSTKPIIKKVERRKRRPLPEIKYSSISPKTFRPPFIAYAIVGPAVMHFSTLAYDELWLFLLINVLPLILLSVSISLASLILSIEYTSDDMLEYMIIGVLIACVISPFFVHTTDVIIFKILIPIAINLVSTIFSFLIFDATSLKELATSEAIRKAQNV